jgi:hypothetical protein
MAANARVGEDVGSTSLILARITAESSMSLGPIPEARRVPHHRCLARLP